MGSETSNAAIRLDNIIKSYGKHDVLKGVTMQVNKGDIYGLVGKNGAGKTTIFKMILGLSEYTSGNVSIAGSRNRKESCQSTLRGRQSSGCLFAS